MDRLAIAAARPSLRVEVVQTHGGTVELKALSEHRVRVHASAPVRGLCGAQGFVYRRGDVDLVVAGQAERWHEDGPARSLVLHFSPALLERTADGLGLRSSHGRLAPRHQLRDAQLAHLAWALEAERADGGLNGRLYVDSLASALAVHLLGRYTLAGRAAPAGLPAPRLRRVLEYIDAHLGEDLSLDALAALAHCSASRFKVLFKRSLGVPVHAYVVRRRVERARELLLQGRMPASEVALAAGFAHQSHMARSMRRVLGVLPSDLARP